MDSDSGEEGSGQGAHHRHEKAKKSKSLGVSKYPKLNKNDHRIAPI
jgi:hypothetical protein